MILIAMIVTAVLFFLAGMHYATWDQNRDDEGASNSAWWSVVLSLIGIYNMLNLIGMASKY
jgi:hypothetical protein